MLSRLRIRDFKSFRDEAIDLGLLVVLVGANAARNRNLLDEALRRKTPPREPRP